MLTSSASATLSLSESIATGSLVSGTVVSVTGSGAASATGAGAGSASGARTALMPSRATPVVSVPGAIETVDDPGWPMPGPEMMAGPRGSAPSGGVRLAPSGTLGGGAISVGASDAGLPSSADADSVCAETVLTKNEPPSAIPTISATTRAHVMYSSPIQLGVRVCLLRDRHDALPSRSFVTGESPLAFLAER